MRYLEDGVKKELVERLVGVVDAELRAEATGRDDGY